MAYFDVVVCGLGATGSAALRELSRRGLRVLGIERFAPVEVSKVRLNVTKSVAPPLIRRLAAFRAGKADRDASPGVRS